jgi:hypothetical protein
MEFIVTFIKKRGKLHRVQQHTDKRSRQSLKYKQLAYTMGQAEAIDTPHLPTPPGRTIASQYPMPP